jgi:hypothetical protein
MDWNQVRDRWHATGGEQPIEAFLAHVDARSGRLRATVLRRDVLETVVAAALLPFFAWLAWRTATQGQWLQFAFSALLVAWIAYVPLRLRAARRALPAMRADMPTRDYLAAERDAMRAQARMLEDAWRWYLAPCAVGVIGLAFATRGFTVRTLVYSAVVLAFCWLLARANRVAARTRFGALADDIDAQIRSLDEDRP